MAHCCRQTNGTNVSHWFCSLQMVSAGLYAIICPLTGLLTHIPKQISIEVKAAAVSCAQRTCWSLQGQPLHFSERVAGLIRGQCNNLHQITVTISRRNMIPDQTSAISLNDLWVKVTVTVVFGCTVGSFCFLFEHRKQLDEGWSLLCCSSSEPEWWVALTSLIINFWMDAELVWESEPNQTDHLNKPWHLK